MGHSLGNILEIVLIIRGGHALFQPTDGKHLKITKLINPQELQRDCEAHAKELQHDCEKHTHMLFSGCRGGKWEGLEQVINK